MQSQITRPKICIVSIAAYPLLSKKETEIVGGAELQCVLLSRELIKQEFDVSFVVGDFGQKSPEIIDSIRVVKAYPVDGYMGIRCSTVSLTWKALSQADAEIYYGFRGVAGIVALYCLLKSRRLIIGIPSDMELEEKRASKNNIHNLLWRFDLKRANHVITQTKYQHDMLKKRFGRESVIIPAFHPVENKIIEKLEPPIVLWVSTIRPQWKQPELFLKLALSIPEARFQMLGGPSEDKEFYNNIKERASKIPNLDFFGFVPHHRIGAFFERASIFVNTSDVEGFPNTFLEAWARYTPVVSLNIDPDEIICQNKLGFHSRTFENLVNDVKILLKDEVLRKSLGKNGRDYVEKNHDLSVVSTKYVELISKVSKPMKKDIR